MLLALYRGLFRPALNKAHVVPDAAAEQADGNKANWGDSEEDELWAASLQHPHQKKPRASDVDDALRDASALASELNVTIRGEDGDIGLPCYSVHYSVAAGKGGALLGGAFVQVVQSLNGEGSGLPPALLPAQLIALSQLAPMLASAPFHRSGGLALLDLGVALLQTQTLMVEAGQGVAGESGAAAALDSILAALLAAGRLLVDEVGEEGPRAQYLASVHRAIWLVGSMAQRVASTRSNSDSNSDSNNNNNSSSRIYRVCILASALAACLEAITALRVPVAPSLEVTLFEGSCMSACLLYWRLYRTLQLLLNSPSQSPSPTMPPLLCLPSPVDLLDETRRLLHCSVSAVPPSSTAAGAVPCSVARSGYVLAGLRYWLASAGSEVSLDPQLAAWTEAVSGSLEVVLGAVLDAARRVGKVAKNKGGEAILRPEAWTLLSLGPVLLEAAAALHARAATRHNVRARADALALLLGGFLSAATDVIKCLRPATGGGIGSRKSAELAITGGAADTSGGPLHLEIGTSTSTSSADGLTTSAFSRSLSSASSPQHSPHHAPLTLPIVLAGAPSPGRASHSLGSSQGSLSGLAAHAQSLGSGARGGGSSLGAGSPASAAAAVEFRVGDRVDGLCLLPNGSSRWFPAVVTAVSEGLEAGAAVRYCLQYNDGDVGTDMARAGVRLTKSRHHASGSATPTSTPTPATVASTPAVAAALSAVAPAAVDAGTINTVRSTVPPPGPSPSPIFKPNRSHAHSHAHPETLPHKAAPPLSDAFDSDNDDSDDDNVFEIPSTLPAPTSGMGRSTAATNAAAAAAGAGGSSRLLQLQLGDIHSQARLAHGPGAGLPTSSSLSSITLDAQAHSTGHAGPGPQAHHLVATTSGTFLLVPEFAEERLSLHSASTLSRPPSSHHHYHTSDSYTFRDIYTHRSTYTARGATPTTGATRFDRPPSSSNATTRESLRPLSRDMRAGSLGSLGGGRRDPREPRASEESGQTATNAGGADDSGTVLTAYTAGSQCTPPAHLEDSGYTRVAHGPDAFSARRDEKEKEDQKEGGRKQEVGEPDSRLLALLLSTGTLAAALCVSACCGEAEGGEGEWGEKLREDLFHSAVGTWSAGAGDDIGAEAEAGSRSLVQAVRDWLPDSAFLHAHIHSPLPTESCEADWKADQQQPQFIPNPLSALYSLCSSRGRRLVTLLGLPPLPSVPLLEACLGRRLGVGAHGSVYRADVGGDREGERGSYAVKRLPKSSTGLVAVEAEVAALQRLAANPPNTDAHSPAPAPALAAALMSFGVVGEEYWLVLQRGGCSLTALRADIPTELLSASPAVGGASLSLWALLLLELFLECGLVLQGVHARGVVHFDVKADNFLLTRPFERAVRACMRPSPQGADKADRADGADRASQRLDGLLAGLREAHRAGRAQGVVVLVDFGESLVGAAPCGACSAAAENAAGAGRVRGTLPIQAPEMLAVTSPPAFASTSAATAADSLVFPAPSFPCDAWSLSLLGVELLVGRFLFLDCSWAELYVLLCVDSGRGALAGLPALLAGAGLAAATGPLAALFAAIVDCSPATRKDVAGVCVEVERAVEFLWSGARGDRGPVAGQDGGSVSPRPAPRPKASPPSAPPLSAFAGWLHLPPSARLPLGSGTALVMLAPADRPPFVAPRGLLDLDLDLDLADKLNIRFTYPGAEGQACDGGGEFMVPVPEGAAEGEETARGQLHGGNGPAAWARLRAVFASLLRLRGPRLDMLLPPAQPPGGAWGQEGCYYPLLPVYLAVLAHACRAQMAASGQGQGGQGSGEQCLAAARGAFAAGGLGDALRGVSWVGLLPPHSIEQAQRLLAALLA